MVKYKNNDNYDWSFSGSVNFSFNLKVLNRFIRENLDLGIEYSGEKFGLILFECYL